MSIIYEALKKVEGRKEVLAPEGTPQSITLPVEEEEKKANKAKKMSFLPAALFLVALGISALPFILPRKKQVQEQGAVIPAVERRKIDPARTYKVPEAKSQTPEEVTLRKEPVQEYILEGIIYDPKAPFALINGRVINESDILGDFQIDRISKDKVDMTNIKDSSKVTLSLPN